MTRTHNKTMTRTLTAIVALMAMYIHAAEYTFQSAGGDLSVPANWGASSLSASDVGVVNQGGTYTLSDDLTLSQIKVSTTDQCLFNFADGNHTVFVGSAQYPANQHPLSVYANNRYVRLNGGTWNFGGTEFRGFGQNSQLYFQGGVIVTNVTRYYQTYYTASYGNLYMRQNAKLYCGSFTLAGKETIRNTLTMQSGAIISTGAFYTDQNSSQNGLKSDNRISISGEGTEISSGAVIMGYITSAHKLSIDDGGAWRANGTFMFGNGDRNSSSNAISISGGTFTVSDDFYTRPNSLDNIFAATNATVSLGSISNMGTRTSYDLRNCNFTVGGFYPFMRGGSRVRFSGADSVLTLSDFVWKKGPFWTNRAGANPGSRLEIDDNATCNVGLGGNTQWMRDSSNCTFIVSNGAKFLTSSPGLSIGNDESLPYCHDNAIEVRSGGLLEISGSGGNGLRIHGTNNTVLVSNGTVRASSVMIGYSNSGPAAHGCGLTLQGDTPKVDMTGAFWLRNDSVLRFELPASGYAADHVPIVARGIAFNPTARIEVEGYAAYLASGGGELTLISFTNDPGVNNNVTFAQWIANQNDALDLPKRCKLMLVHDANGYKVVFRARNPSGLVVSFH